jgi:hypothetical protein
MSADKYKFTAFFPSGKVQTCQGASLEILTVSDELGINPVIMQDDTKVAGDTKKAIFVDPRCVIYMDDHLVYEPRSFESKMSKDFQKWMVKNMDWPARLADDYVRKMICRVGRGKSHLRFTADGRRRHE